jgi:hypothetical protein
MVLFISDGNDILAFSDSCKGSFHEIYVRRIDSSPIYLSHLIGYVNIFYIVFTFQVLFMSVFFLTWNIQIKIHFIIPVLIVGSIYVIYNINLLAREFYI